MLKGPGPTLHALQTAAGRQSDTVTRSLISHAAPPRAATPRHRCHQADDEDDGDDEEEEEEDVLMEVGSVGLLVVCCCAVKAVVRSACGVPAPSAVVCQLSITADGGGRVGLG